jgi:hypothetical protein
MHSPNFTPPGHGQHHSENPMEEITGHVGLEILGLGGLAMVLSMLKIKNTLMDANRSGGVAVRPTAALKPSLSFKPGA